ncbi:hypothetical protein JA1_003900 [Spathaspora sp. JA1]|nr:hypothetical protein JA1_003900 [Spathaspora sp. JA1]
MSEQTSSALLEQLVYIDTFMNGQVESSTATTTPNLDIDGQLGLDLAAFADDSFIFPDEEKPKKENEDDNDHESSNNGHSNNNNGSNWANGDFNHMIPSHSFDNHNHHRHNSAHDLIPQQPRNNQPEILSRDTSFLNLTDLPKFPVPPGAKSSLVHAGLSSNQIDLLSALVAQHQASLGNQIPSEISTSSSLASTLSGSPPTKGESPVRQHSQLFLESNSGPIGYVPSPTTSTYSNTPDPSELDKRRRNTAASARFRIKKKIKEKEMEGKIHNLTELIGELENKLQQLEMENKLLRNLIIEKGSQKSDDEVKMLRERAKRN